MVEVVELFTDGACRGNPGPGGWGVLMRYKGHNKELYGAETHTTNNRMELTAAIMGLESLKRRCKVRVTTDSEYLRKGITGWIEEWKKRGWKTSAKKPVKNEDLWQRLDKAAQGHDVDWHWVRGHTGHKENEIADSLANKAIDEMLNSL